MGRVAATTGCRRSGPAITSPTITRTGSSSFNDDLFVEWEKILKFEVGGKDYGVDAEPDEQS
jgi:hypothetical protein